MTQQPMVDTAGILTALALLIGCGGAPSETRALAPASTAAPGSPRPGEWATWSHEQKESYMRKAVLPKMGHAFFDFDAAMFASPSCTLCHVTGAKDQSFKMPDPGLPQLPSTPAGLKALSATEPSVFEFMAKTVVPDTAALLGVEPYDPGTGRGLGCFTCHTKM
jgi:hypothetical protein